MGIWKAAMYETDAWGFIHRFGYDPISEELMRGAGMRKSNAPGPFRPAGAGSLVTFRCAKCERKMTTGGRKQIKRGGLALGWLCRECV